MPEPNKRVLLTNPKENVNQVNYWLNFFKILFIILNVVLIILLIVTFIMEIVVHQRPGLLRDLETRDPIEHAFAKSGCLAVILTGVILVSVPIYGLCGLCCLNIWILFTYSIMMLITCVVGILLLPFGYAYGGLFAANSIVGIIFISLIQRKNSSRGNYTDVPLEWPCLNIVWTTVMIRVQSFDWPVLL